MELRAYGVATTMYFPLIDKGATDFESTPVTIASGDCKISKDGGSFANTTTASFSHVAGGIYSIPLTATEMQAKVVVIKIVDQTNPKEWEDQCIIITTVNHASAEIPSLWSIMQSTATGAIAAASFAAGAIDAAAIADNAIDAGAIASNAITSAKIATDAIGAAQIAADAIGSSELASSAVTEIQSGLSTLDAAGVRTAVGLASANLDTQLSSISGKVDAVDDYVDTEVAAIKAKTDNLPSDPASASTIATAFGVTNGKIDAVDDYVDTEVAAIKAKTDNLPSDPADASDIAAAFSTVNSKLDAIDDYVDTEIAAIKAKTDNLPASPAASSDCLTAAGVRSAIGLGSANLDTQLGDLPTAIENADALLKRDVDNVEASAPVHSLASVVLKLVSRFVASTGRTYRTDGVTIHMTQVPSVDPTADPITELGAAS